MMGRSTILIWSVMVALVICGCEKEKGAKERAEKKETKETDEEAEKGKGAAMGITVEWLGHASFKIRHGDAVIYIDPWKLTKAPHDATLVLVSHSHYDHYSAKDIAKASGPETKLTASADVVAQEGKGHTMTPGLRIELDGVNVAGMPAYNPDKKFHPRQKNWLGFVIEINSARIYYAGDTDLTDEIRSLSDIDVALLPVGGTYTMNAEEAAEAARYIRPKLAIPYHWGDIVGSRRDAERFAEKAECKVTVLRPGETVDVEQ
jgi:L-ascorbate metabolism protein UlaG (beta-lactamase superfamily)